MNVSQYFRHYNLLFSPDLLQRVQDHTQPLCTDKDFPVKKGLSVRDEAQRAYRIARSAWESLRAAASDPEAQQRFFRTIFCDVLGYDAPFICPESGIPPEFRKDTPFVPVDTAAEDDPAPQSLFPVSMMLSCGKECFTLPVLVVPQNAELDTKFNFSTGQRMTPTQMTQAFLNASQEYLWAIVTNGSNWRLLRDNPSLSRPCYLDIDLEQIMQDDAIAAFDGVFWRMLHFSRADRQPDRGADSCLWEQWHRDLEEHGARVREGLRDGVEEALCCLGTGFLCGTGEGNDYLRAKLAGGELSAQDYYNQLMRLAYRIIFLSVLEDRGLLHEHSRADKQATERATAIYAKGYSLSRLIPLAMFAEQEDSRYDDLWQAQLIVFRALGQDAGSPELALPALGGIFSPEQCPDLDACRLPNSAFLSALHFLRWSSLDNKRTLIDYVNMDAEELGSIYEGLLELTPRVDSYRRSFYFVGGSHDPSLSASTEKKRKGNVRKATGSYYTPSCLVEQVLRCALDPLLDECCQSPVYTQRKILDLRIIDPACGSGHFLLAAARRLADRLAKARTQGQIGYTPQVFSQAMHEVISHCIYGVDINPMAVELVRMNLWLEGYQPGKALSFLDDHLRCGNSLLGVFDAKSLLLPIPADAFTCHKEDDKEVKNICSLLRARNRKQIKNRKKSVSSLWEGNLPEQSQRSYGDDRPSQVREHACTWKNHHEQLMVSRTAITADIRIGAFILPKLSEEFVPTTATLDNFYAGIIPADDASIQAARQACMGARVFHWFLEFKEIFDHGGFDCVIGNPPWEKVQFEQKNWFAARNTVIANASGGVRKQYIDLLRQGRLAATLYPQVMPSDEASTAETNLYREYLKGLRTSNANSNFFRKGDRFLLTGTDCVNMYALFAELFRQLIKVENGRAGIIVPTGIATDDSTSAFFNDLVRQKRLNALYDFENKEGLFRDVHRRQKMSILAMAPSETIDVACYMTDPQQLSETERHAHLQARDFIRFNPNTGTCPLFRCTADAELSVKVYRAVPVLLNERTGENPWGVNFRQGPFNMTNDSHFFLTSIPEGESVLPLYEGKLVHHFDYRFNTFEDVGPDSDVRRVTEAEKQNPDFQPSPRYWVRREDVLKKLPKCCKPAPKWFIGFRDVTNSSTGRTLALSLFPFAGVGNSIQLLFTNQSTKFETCLVANACSLVLDYIVRQKIDGVHCSQFHIKQLPFLPPTAYGEEDVAYISQRVLELSYTSYSMKPLAEALGYGEEPFVWDEDRRAQLMAELDAYYAKLYNLTREELAYILDPTTRYPKNCPTETFRVLQNEEMKAYGEYRTKRLVLAAYDELTRQGK